MLHILIMSKSLTYLEIWKGNRYFGIMVSSSLVQVLFGPTHTMYFKISYTNMHAYTFYFVYRIYTVQKSPTQPVKKLLHDILIIYAFMLSGNHPQM